MNRRDTVFALLALGAMGATAHAQEKPRRVAWFGVGRTDTPSLFLEAFREGMRDIGWIEGRNLALSVYFTQGLPEDSERIGRQMLATNPELVVVYGRDVPVARRLKPECPVVFAFSGNPIDAGIVQSFARPGSNFTGVSFMSLDLVGKRIELLRELAPQIRRLAVLARPEHAGEHRERAVSEEISGKLGISLVYAPIQAEAGLESALQGIERQKCDALVAFPDAVMLANSGRIAKFAVELKIASVSGWGTFADNGFLLSYGPNLQDSYRGLARYADRVLRGARPDELPVQLPRTVELVLNTRTARSLGIKIPQSVLLRADRVIE